VADVRHLAFGMTSLWTVGGWVDGTCVWWY